MKMNVKPMLNGGVHFYPELALDFSVILVKNCKKLHSIDNTPNRLTSA